MDPNHAYIEFLAAMSNNDREQAFDFAEALYGWLINGGFEPDDFHGTTGDTFWKFCDDERISLR